MVGLIPESDIDIIRERINLVDFISQYVSLQKAGVNSYRGLCPFHEEKTPSFFVRPESGQFHCFGCGESGDIYTFIQKQEQLNFVEAVEKLADSINYKINYQGGGQVIRKEKGTKTRLLEANKVAADFYETQLKLNSAALAQEFLTARKFTLDQAAEFNCGYAPDKKDVLTKMLLQKGFDAKELIAAGLSKSTAYGLVDRFRNRLVWPIKNSVAEVIGFGARKLSISDNAAKYLNTPETLLYKKSRVLFGLDLAKVSIAKHKKVIVVEGYTDVMALHSVGVKEVVAPCGTAFGADHMAALRRYLLDDSFYKSEIIYIFDGDQAGRAAAIKAFNGDQALVGQSYVCIIPENLDPCDYRIKYGDISLKSLIAKRIPLFEFVIKNSLVGYDLRSAEGMVHALTEAIPIVAQIKDKSLLDEYARRLAGWVGWHDPNEIVKRVRAKAGFTRAIGFNQSVNQNFAKRLSTSTGFSEKKLSKSPNQVREDVEREVLKLQLQYPFITFTEFKTLTKDCFTTAKNIELFTLLQKMGNDLELASTKNNEFFAKNWLFQLREKANDTELEKYLAALAVTPIEVSPDNLFAYAVSICARLQAFWVEKEIKNLRAELQRASSMNTEKGDKRISEIFSDLIALENYHRSLQEKAKNNNY